jgi:hypothetical protein
MVDAMVMVMVNVCVVPSLLPSMTSGRIYISAIARCVVAGPEVRRWQFPPTA